MNIKMTCGAAFLALPASSPELAADGDPNAGKTKAVACVGCHGMNGVSVNPQWPNLAGQHVPYLVKQMQAFKAGQRADPNMTALAQTLSDTDMMDIAAFFSSQTCE